MNKVFEIRIAGCEEHSGSSIRLVCPYCRIAELEQFVEQTKHTGDINVHRTKRIEELEQQLEEWKALAQQINTHWIPANQNLASQNAKLVEALENLSKLGNGDKVGNSIGNQIAAAALKEMEVRGE